MRRYQLIPSFAVQTLLITSTSPLPSGTVGVSYSFTFNAIGGVAPYTWTETGGLPSGLSLAPSGTLSGTPSATFSGSFVVKVTDNVGSPFSATFSLNIASATLTITTSSPLPAATQSSPYSFTMAASGGTPPYTWSLTSQTGSNGWSVSSAGVVTATPATAETDTLVIKVVDSVATPASGNFNLTVNSASAASWKILPVGAGGFVRGLIIAADGTMVGRTDTAGAYLWNGSTWNQLVTATSMPAAFVSGHFSNGMLGVYELAIAPTNTQIFYMNYFNNMWKSTNQGTTWTQLAGYGTKSCNANDNAAQIGQKIAVDPNNANIVYVGTETNGLFVSTDGGTTWNTVSGVPASGVNGGICGIAFGPASNVIAGVTQVIYACRQGTGVYVTTNGGTSWTLTSGGPLSVINALIDNTGNYWCAGAATSTINGTAVYKYTASGGTWANILTGGGNGVQSVGINPTNNNQIVCVDRSCSQMNFSANGGSTWSGANFNTSKIDTTIPWLGPSEGTGTSFFFDAGNAVFNPSSGNLVVAMGVGVFSMTVPGTVTNSTTLLWNGMSVGIENLTSNEIIVPPGAGPVIAVWDRCTFFLTTGTYPSTDQPPTIDTINAAWAVDYASSDPTFVTAIIYYDAQESGFSHNGGASWTQFATFPTGATGSVGGCIAASTPSNILMAVQGNNAPSYTTNGGGSWTQISIPAITNWNGFMPGLPDGTWRKICADRVSANTFYLYFTSLSASAGTGVYRSTDGGATWAQQHAGFIETNSGYASVLAQQLKAVPGNAGHLFYCSGPNSAGTITSPLSDDHFFRSTDGGATWSQVANVLQVSAFGFGAPLSGGGGYPAVFINGFVSGVFGFWRSDDNCATWNQLNGQFAGPHGLCSVISMSGDMSIYGRCYVGLGGFNAGAGYAYYG